MITRDEFLRRVAAKKAEIADESNKLSRVRELIESIGESPTLTKLLTFLRTLKEILGI